MCCCTVHYNKFDESKLLTMYLVSESIHWVWSSFLTVRPKTTKSGIQPLMHRITAWHTLSCVIHAHKISLKPRTPGHVVTWRLGQEKQPTCQNHFSIISDPCTSYNAFDGRESMATLSVEYLKAALNQIGAADVRAKLERVLVAHLGQVLCDCEHCKGQYGLEDDMLRRALSATPGFIAERTGRLHAQKWNGNIYTISALASLAVQQWLGKQFLTKAVFIFPDQLRCAVFNAIGHFAQPCTLQSV